MPSSVDEILVRIKEERQRQFDLPGSEWDGRNTPGEWTAIVSHYVSEEVRRNGMNPSKEAFEDSLVKAAAVIIAALEHCAQMQDRGALQ